MGLKNTTCAAPLAKQALLRLALLRLVNAIVLEDGYVALHTARRQARRRRVNDELEEVAKLLEEAITEGP